MYEQEFDRLLVYCRQEEWQGYDPYDGLNSKFYPLMPDSKILRIVLIQLVKRSPLNLRPLLGIEKGENPKGLALFVRALLSAYQKTKDEKYRSDAEELLERLWALRSPGYEDRMCWGYNFDWQSRAFFVPKGTPSIVCTTFVAQAWLDHYQLFKEETSLEVARSACSFILEDLHKTEDENSFCFSYTPLDKSQVHNANLLGAELLARVAKFTHEVELIEKAILSARFTVKRQAKDGSWPYGVAENQQWIDNFHTGFNLVSLYRVVQESNINEWKGVLEKGLEFYLKTFFLPDGTPKYYHNNTYPIDIHSSAQALVTFIYLKSLIPENSLIKKVAEWTLANMQDKEGFFYFQKTGFLTNKISYLRWSQAWMAYALALATYGEIKESSK
jgi:hypothetical protein